MQFSKKLVAAIMIFWIAVRVFSAIAVFINPDCSESMTRVLAGVDDIAMVNCLAYTGNSISEKLSVSYFKYRSCKAQENDDDETEESNG